ncbi:MAG: hypothetical protein ACRDKS_07565 [Actinomycetota bacterium]
MPPKKRASGPKRPPSRGARVGAKPAFTRTCSRCGTTEACAEDGLPPGWSMGMDGRRVEYLCPRCARANIRAIEGRLTEEY